MPVTGDRGDNARGGVRTEPAWHERTPTLVGASAAALVVLALLYFLISTMVREFGEPDQAPQYYLDPGGSSSAYRTSSSTSSTTTQTITSTSPPVTSDINPGDPTSTTSSSNTSTSTSTRRPTTGDDEPRTTRSRPRLNETRTLYPRP